MDENVRFIGVGAYLYGALAFVGIFTAGLAYTDKLAVLAAIAGSAAAYGSQLMTANSLVYGKGEGIAFALMLASIVAGVAGFVSLVWS